MRVSTLYVRALVEALRVMGHDAEGFLHATPGAQALLEGLNGWVDLADLDQLSAQVLSHVGRDDFGVVWAHSAFQQFDLGRAAAYAPNLRAALERLREFQERLADAPQLTYEESAEQVRFSVHPLAIAPACRRVRSDFAVLAMFRLLRTFGVKQDVLSVYFAHPRPHYAEAYRAVIHAPIQFGHEHTGFTLRRSALDRPNPPLCQEAANGSAAGASQPGSQGGSGGEQPGAAAPALQRSLKPSLQWKRYATFESDLAAALDLAPEQLCSEFGKEPCIRGVHLGPLGGHDIRTGLLESPSEPLITTPTVVERVVLSACLARVELERKGGATVFAGLDLSRDAPAPGSEPARMLVTALLRRFFARDPSDEELEVLGSLTRDERGAARTAAEFAIAVCIALGSSSEFLFF